MLLKKLLTSILLIISSSLSAQVNMLSTNPVAEQIMLGNYNPADYQATNIINHPDDIIAHINNEVNPDSVHSYLLTLSSFHTRHTASDTMSQDTGIGAARRWAYHKFRAFSQNEENRLVVSYLQFDTTICSMSQHRNIFTVLPGLQTEDPSIIIIEGHIDSRCESRCDSVCQAHGMEDNGSGSALVLELARVMSHLSFHHTIVFMLTIGEEQGLFGAQAFADYAIEKGIEIKAVLNNDIVGGIICGETSSGPSCPGLNHIDSTQVRLFSQGNYNSPNKGLARFVKLEYEEELKPIVSVPMQLTIMSAEDRQGRGGDHIPFRRNGFSAIRFTSANEHGNADSDNPNYHDRQHTTGDLLGIDTDNNMVIDSFFVDFNYLCRNAVINGVAAGMIGIGPEVPDFNAYNGGDGNILIDIMDQNPYDTYRVGVRVSGSNDFDTIFTIHNVQATVQAAPANIYYVSVASVDSNGIESCFSREYLIHATNDIDEIEQIKGVSLLQNSPNPFDEATTISVLVDKPAKYEKAYIIIRDLQGKLIQQLPMQLEQGMNDVIYFHGYNATGTYIYSLEIDGKVIESKRMVFAY